MRQKNAAAMIAVFFTVLLFLSVLTVLSPKIEISELENRVLQPFPEFTISDLWSGSWGQKITAYLQDHFYARDKWIDAASYADTVLFQKTEVNGILLGRDGRMFSKAFAVQPDTAQYQKNLKAITQFAERWHGKVTFMLVPSSDLVYCDQLPVGAPQLDEQSMLDSAFHDLSPVCTVIDLRPVFARGKQGDSLYFRTDHHWTLEGAYLAYQTFCQTKGLLPFDRGSHSLREIPDFYGSYYRASRWADAKADTLSWFELDTEMRVYRVGGEMQYTLASTGPAFSEEKGKTVDKYSAFLDGNHGYSELSGTGNGKILVIKDSYANCFVPFLTENYETVGVMDFRDFSFGPDSTISQLGYDDILILYSFHNFREDNHLIYLNRPTTLKTEE